MRLLKFHRSTPPPHIDPYQFDPHTIFDTNYAPYVEQKHINVPVIRKSSTATELFMETLWDSLTSTHQLVQHDELLPIPSSSLSNALFMPKFPHPIQRPGYVR